MKRQYTPDWIAELTIEIGSPLGKCPRDAHGRSQGPYTVARRSLETNPIAIPQGAGVEGPYLVGDTLGADPQQTWPFATQPSIEVDEGLDGVVHRLMALARDQDLGGALRRDEPVDESRNEPRLARSRRALL